MAAVFAVERVDMPESSQQFRYLATSTTDSGASLTAGRYSYATLATALGVTEAIARSMVRRMKSADGANGGAVKRGIEITPFGAGSDTQTFTIIVWQVKFGSAQYDEEFEIQKITTLSCTLTTATGVSATSQVTSSEKFVDTITKSNAAFFTNLISPTYGGNVDIALHSPADNTPGRAVIPDLGNGGYLLEMYVGTATSANALVSEEV